jgi:hypothetical protein
MPARPRLSPRTGSAVPYAVAAMRKGTLTICWVRRAALGSLLLVFSGCSSTNHSHSTDGTTSRSLVAALEKEAPRVPRDALHVGSFKGLVHTRYLSLLTGGNRRAVVVRLVQIKRLQINVPILIHLFGGMNTLVYSNGSAGLDPTIQHISLLQPGHDLWWVDDQIPASWPVAEVTLKVGTGPSTDPRSLPNLTTAGVKLEQRAKLNIVHGSVVNHSTRPAHNVVVSAVVLLDKRVVAAGRAVVQELPPRPARASFHIALVGKPQGGRVELSVTPTLG